MNCLRDLHDALSFSLVQRNNAMTAMTTTLKSAMIMIVSILMMIMIVSILMMMIMITHSDYRHRLNGDT